MDQLEYQIDCRFAVGTTVHEITNEDNPPLLIIGLSAQILDNRNQFFDLTMQIPDDRNRTLNLGLKFQ